MKKYNLLLSIRNMRKNKLFTFINFSGLVIGMTISLLIFKYVQYELSYDKFHEHGEDIYRVRYDSYRDGVEQFKCVGAIPALGPALKADFTEVEEFCRLNPFYDGLTVMKDKNVYRFQNVFFADPSFFSVFSFKAVSGDIANSLHDVATAVISENVANKLFGDLDPVGHQFSVPIGDEDISVTVTAVMEDVPDNSHLKFDILISYSSLVARTGNDAETSWGWYDFYTYIKLAEGTDYKQLEARFPEFVAKYTPDSEREYVLQPLHDIHLTSNYLQEMEANGNKNMVIALGIIGVFILIIAWANYINLSAVVAFDRIKEIGVRKTNGASKKQILYQFFSESLIINILCFLISVFLFRIFLSSFEILTKKPLSLVTVNFNVWILLFSFVLFGSFISGAIPAFYISSFNPVKALKGTINNEKRLNPRKILVGFQYIISIVLIISTIYILKQINFIREYNLGVDIERTLVVQGPINTNFDNYNRDYNIFKQELLNYSTINSVTASTNVPGYEIIWTRGVQRVGSDIKSATMYLMAIDHDYIDAYNLKILEGRNFYGQGQSENQNVLVNRSALKLLEFEDPQDALNKNIRIGGDNYTIVGIIEDYHQRSLKEAPAPLVIHYGSDINDFYSIKTSGDNLPEVLSFVRKKYSEVFPENAFDYFFLDSFFDQQYKTDVQFGKVISLFTILAIFICSLGLFGLAVFSVKKRIKEIGIRKVNGARTLDLLQLINAEYLLWIFAAFIVATPIARYFVIKWLENFAYKTILSWWVFVLAGAIATGLALITVTWQSWRAATRNPVEALRYE